MRLFRKGTAQSIDVSLGCPVFTSDNEAIGYVKEVGEEVFKVDVPMGSDFWLPEECIRVSNDKEIVIDVPRGEIDRFRMSDAEARREAYRPPLNNQFFSQARGSVISDEEQMQQRERMERELAEQRQRIHEN